MSKEALSVEDTLKLVPTEPTNNMKSAASQLFARNPKATPSDFYKVMVATAKEALAQPEPSPEWMTEEEQTAYTFGWFKALESQRIAQPEQKHVAKVCHDLDGHIGWNPKLTQLPDEGTPLYTHPPVPFVPQEHMAQLKVRTGDCLLTGVCASEGHKIQPKEPEQEYQFGVYSSEDLDKAWKSGYDNCKAQSSWTLEDVKKAWKRGYAAAKKEQRQARVGIYTTPPQRKPLTLEQLREHWQVAKVLDMTDAEIDFADYVLITRDVEALHGIKE